MKILKHLRCYHSELYFIASILYYWILTGTLLNPVAAVLLIILACLIIFKNRVLGICISALFLLLNIYMVLAMLSELNEFESFNARAKQLAIFGSLYLGLNIAFSISMLIKWGRITPQPKAIHSI